MANSKVIEDAFERMLEQGVSYIDIQVYLNSLFENQIRILKARIKELQEELHE